MKSVMLWAVVLLSAFVIVGCEWTGTTEDVSGGGSSINDGDGNDDGSNDGTDDGNNDGNDDGTDDDGNDDGDNPPSGDDQISDTERAVYNEGLATGNASSTRYSGAFDNRPLVAGSVSIDAGGFHFSDDGSGGLTGSDGKSGAVVYQTGAWWIDLGVDVIPGEGIYGSYAYLIPASTP